MKKTYITPELEVIELNAQAILAGSGHFSSDRFGGLNDDNNGDADTDITVD